MALRDVFLNMLGAETPEVQKTSNGAIRSARDFLRNGSRDRLYPTWSEIKMSDMDMYSGYSYAVIQKRGNKVASLAKNNLKTWAKPEVVDEYQKKNETVYHPYLKLIEDSTKFTEKQFWKNISIYLDLAGRYYLGVVRSEIKPFKDGLPTVMTDPIEFVMLNPYEIRRVIDKNKNVAGYIERKKDGRYREWPVHQIIEMKELNPFDPENSQWAMTDAAKNAVYTINQSGDYTRQSLNGNIDAPGIITTDVLLTDEDFANFKARVTQHTKGEPLFGNGTGAIKWDSMQIDLDKAALLDINEINRTELFAVSGTSKTSLGIEQSGTTRETSRVQSEQFISDTAQPRVEDIVDFLNLDYKKYYTREYDKTGYKIEVESAVGKDYDTEQKATALKQSQFQLAMQLIQAGYTQESAYQFAEGAIDFSDLELEKGLDKPKNPEAPEEPEEPEGEPTKPDNKPSGDGGNDNTDGNTEKNNSLDLGLEPHSDLVENGGKGSGNHGHSGRPGQVGGSGKGGGKVTHREYSSDGKNVVAEWDEIEHPIYKGDYIIKSDTQIGMLSDSRGNFGIADKAYDVRDKRLKDPFEVFEPIDEAEREFVRDYIKKSFKIDDKELDEKIGKTKNSVEGEKCDPLKSSEGKECACGCEHDHKVETLLNEVSEDNSKVIDKAHKEFLNDIRKIEKETINATIRKLEINAFDESDIIGKKKKASLLEKLTNTIRGYWWLIFPLLANSSMGKRNKEFDRNISFVFTNELQSGVRDNASRVAEGHLNTILNDILEASNKAYTNILEESASELIIKAYKVNPDNFGEYFEYEPTQADALAAIRKTDILDKNRKIYEKANKMAFEGYKREDIVKAIRAEYKDISEKRATLIARNETSRAFTQSQFEADRQFLNGVGKMAQAYKVWYSRRPATEQDKICEFCNSLIEETNANPIPFEQPFLAYGDSIEAYNSKGELKIFVANYENIEGGTLHPNCMCGYKLVFKNEAGEFVKTLNELELNGGDGSGNHGHAGRPGEVGGSAPKGSGGQSVEEKFDTLAEATNWSDEEKAYAELYFDAIEEEFNTIQDYAKGGEDDWVDKAKGIKASDVTKVLDKKIAESSLPEDTLLYRGLLIEPDKLKELEKNGFQAQGFQSTSLEKKVSYGYLDAYGDYEEYDNYSSVILKINAKKGSKFASATSNGEFEILLPRNATFKNVKLVGTDMTDTIIYEVDYE